MPFIALGESLTVPGNHLPALLQPLLVALRMETISRISALSSSWISFGALPKMFFESVLLATLL